MFLKNVNLLLILSLIMHSLPSHASNEVNLKDYVLAGSYKLISGPREVCGKLRIEENEVADPLFIGPTYNFSIENSLQIFPSENNKSCEMNRRNQFEKKASSTLVLTYTREETCQAQTKIQQKIQATLSKGSIQISDSAPGESTSTCVWKLRPENTKDKK
jgi:hypothetical protein